MRIPTLASTMLTLLLMTACTSSRASRREITVPEDEQRATLAEMRPPKRARPVIAIVGANAGAETTDYLVPFSVLTRANVGEVVALSTRPGPLHLMPALTIQAQDTTAGFDARFPEGADYVVVPAQHDPSDAEVIAWVKRQHDRGATIVGICSGARVLSKAGLLQGRRATGHWYDLDDLREENPTMRWVADRRYVVDRGVVTTTGVTASIPASLALVEAIAGRARAEQVARELGVARWSPEHDSEAFRTGRGYIWTVIRNEAAFWGHDRFGVPVEPGVDELALALMADAYSRTFRSQAITVGASLQPLQTRNGLQLLPDVTRTDARGLVMLGPVRQQEPSRALDEALEDLAHRYDVTTAAWVARQVEYPGRHSK